MKPTPTQLNLPFCTEPPPGRPLRAKGGAENRLSPEDRAFHDWYRFVLSYPPHLVGCYMQEFGLDEHGTVLDPFCGTGTTLIEAKLRGVSSVGLEANPFAQFASSIKTDWSIDPDALLSLARRISESAIELLRRQGLDDALECDGKLDEPMLRKLPPQAAKLLITDSISPLPLHKALVLLDCINDHQGESCYQHCLLALANALVFSISNLHFGPEVGVGKIKRDAPVVQPWLNAMQMMANDLRKVCGKIFPESRAYLADARHAGKVLQPRSIDAVITSPPYPNEKDYTRTTRLESVVLGFVKDRSDLRANKQKLIRSNTRGVYSGDDDDKWIPDQAEIDRIANAIEERRKELGKTSGFERLYGRVTKLYFGGMARHLAELRTVLRPGAHLAYVVGDQASYLRVMIRTGQLFAEIGQSLGYDLVRIDLFRTRFATATRQQLREEVVILRWPGKDSRRSRPIASRLSLDRPTIRPGDPDEQQRTLPCRN